MTQMVISATDTSRYAYLGGPFVVMTYDNDNYGIFNMDAVTAHETGHIFYAEDQYTSAGRGCTASSGYLNVQNQNSAYPYAGACLSNVASIMRGQVSPYTMGAVDTYARQQVGWRDTDSDTVMDILDFEPQTALNPHSPDPTSDSTPTYTGSATASSSVYPNNNPWSFGNSITINKIATVEYRIDSGPWISAIPSDGAFDGTSEAFTFTTAPLADGTYVFEVRAVHTGGAADSTPASDVLGIVTQYQLTISVSPPSGGSTNPATGSHMYEIGTSVSVASHCGSWILFLLLESGWDKRGKQLYIFCPNELRSHSDRVLPKHFGDYSWSIASLDIARLAGHAFWYHNPCAAITRDPIGNFGADKL